MDHITNLINFILHLNIHLVTLVNYFDNWTYLVLFLIIFAETGLIITPFLPGDSLLFAAGALSAISGIMINVHILVCVLFIAAVLGDSFNYFIGNLIGEKVFTDKAKILNTKYLMKTHSFYAKYGGKTLIIARFVPIVRTFAPFAAGAGTMKYKRFLLFNIIGAGMWIISLTYLGYFFGSIPIIKNNFGVVIMLIIIISITPGIYEWIKYKYLSKKYTD